MAMKRRPTLEEENIEVGLRISLVLPEETMRDIPEHDLSVGVYLSQLIPEITGRGLFTYALITALYSDRRTFSVEYLDCVRRDIISFPLYRHDQPFVEKR